MAADRATLRALTRQPTISVCVPTWNRAPLVDLSLRSILNQTLTDFEIVVVDDGSTDRTRHVVSAFGDCRVRYFRHARSVGIARARNTCLSLARGRFIAWLDSDDLYASHALATLARTIDSHPTVGLVHAGYDLIDEAGEPLKGWPLPFDAEVVESRRSALEELTLANYITTTTVLTRREVYEQAGRFAPEMRNNCEDWELWLRLALVTDFAFTPAVVTHVRLHGGNMHREDIRSGRRVAAQIRAVERFFRAHRAQIPEARILERRARAAIAATIVTHARGLLLRGRPEAASRTLARLARHAASIVATPTILRLQTAASRGDEFRLHVESRALLRRIAVELDGSRFVERLRKSVTPDPDWECESRDVARVLRRVTDDGARVAVVDKWDPTIIHLSRRRGCHFPDLRMLPDGYPRRSEDAIAHVEALRRRGVTHLAVPARAFWWFEHYDGFRAHLQLSYRRTWDDPTCVVFALQTAGSGP
jgi:glycosyltransferase involved in cell wall biosynthesis